MEEKRVLLGMSGGVDSSVSALLLKEQGYEVVGTTMELFAGSSCCNTNTYIDAKNVCNQIGVPHFIYNFKDEFKISLINICPGAWVITKGNFAFIITFCGVTPQAQNTGISPSFIIGSSPKSAFKILFIPISLALPICTGAP